MSRLCALLLLFATPAAAQTSIAPSHTRLIGCFGEAFTIVEHVWRIAPAHLRSMIEHTAGRLTDEQRQLLRGMVTSATQVDQASAFAVLRNLDGCITQAMEDLAPDGTTAVLATAVRVELDSAIEDAGALVDQVSRQEAMLRQALPVSASDRALDTPLDEYLTFGARMRVELVRVRSRADALIAASTPRR